MADNIILNTTKKELKEMEMGGGELAGKKEEEIVKRYIDEDKRRELEEQRAILEEELHQAPSVHADQIPITTTQQTLPEKAVIKSEFLLQIEKLLADNLGEIYMKMDSGLKERFKLKGEAVACRIERMIAKGKVRIKQIVNWIREWLRMIPHVNRFFLEQEAKIKADKILAMAG